MNFDMISLCKEKDSIYRALESINGSVYIRESIRLYLEAYGADYDFSQFYLQYAVDKCSAVTAVVVRYNNQIYALADDNADTEELSAFLCGIEEADLIADEILSSYFCNSKPCFCFCKNGEVPANMSTNIKITDSAKSIAELVTKTYNEQEKLDFFLNTSHQIRHNLIKAFGYYSEDKLASVVSATNIQNDLSVITFVFTDDHFRGNGIASQLLSAVCSDVSKKYVLLCEEHNVKFYEKCGFDCISHCIKIRL